MPTPIEVKTCVIGKEGTRGTANASPTKYIPITNDSEFEHKLIHLPDELLRGIQEQYEPTAGIKETTGKLVSDVESNNVGEFLYSLLGIDTTTNPSAGVYQHIFTWDNSNYQRPSYTVYLKRTLGAGVTFDKRYPMSVAKSMNFTQSVDGKLRCETNFLAQTEEASAFSFAPSFAVPDPFTFNNLQIKIPSSSSVRTDIKDININIDNQSQAYRVINQSQLPYDIITHQRLLVTGGFTIFFANLTDYNYFLTNTSTDLSASWIGTEISGGYYKTLTILLRSIHYTAFPFSNVDGLLGAAVAFNSFYSPGTSQTLQVTLINTDTDYSA